MAAEKGTTSKLTTEQSSVLTSIRKDISSKLKSGNCTLNDIEEITDRIEKNGIPDDFLLYNTGTYPLLDSVYDLLFRMLYYVGSVDESLLGVHERLVRINSALMALESSGAYTTDDIAYYQDQLREIDELDDGLVIRVSVGSDVPMGQALLHGLLHRTHKLATKLLIRAEVDPAVDDVYITLTSLVREVGDLRGRMDVTLDQVSAIQEHLKKISETRMADGKFVDKNGKVAGSQTALIELLERAYDGVHELLASADMDSESVDPSMQKLHQELKTVIATLRRLHAIRFTHPVQLELRQCQKRLLDIDEERRDGKFLDIDGNVCKGQATLHYMMAKAFDLCHEILCSEEASQPQTDELGQLYLLLVSSRSALRAMHRNPDKDVLEQTQRSIVDAAKEMKRLGLFDRNRPDGQSMRFLYHQTLDLLQWTLIRINV